MKSDVKGESGELKVESKASSLDRDRATSLSGGSSSGVQSKQSRALVSTSGVAAGRQQFEQDVSMVAKGVDQLYTESGTPRIFAVAAMAK